MALDGISNGMFGRTTAGIEETYVGIDAPLTALSMVVWKFSADRIELTLVKDGAYYSKRL